MTKLQIGAQLYSIRDRTQTAPAYRAALKELAQMGYRTCQVSGQSRDISFSEIRDMLDGAGLEAGATHVAFSDMVENFSKVVKNHRILGCAYPGIGAMPEKYRLSSEGYIAFAKEFGAIAERFQDEGMRLIYHNHNFEFERFEDVNKTGMDLLLEHAPKALQFELYVFWVQAAGASPVEWIRRVAGRMDVVHFKEMAYAPGLTVAMAPIGCGNMNWTDIMAACDDIGVKYAFIEQDNAVDTDSIECMRASIENLRGLGGRF